MVNNVDGLKGVFGSTKMVEFNGVLRLIRRVSSLSISDFDWFSANLLVVLLLIIVLLESWSVDKNWFVAL